MKNRHKRHILAVSMLFALILASMPVLVGAQSKVIQSTAVAGELNEQFAKHYLGLRPIDPSSSMEVTLTYDPADARNFGFYIFDEAATAEIVQGGKRLNQVSNVAALSASGAGNTLTAVIAKPVGKFTIVVYNDSTRPVRYELRVKNGLIRDDAGQIKDLNAPATEEEEAAPATKEPTQAPTAAEEATATEEATPAPAATPTPKAAPAMQKTVVRASKLSGELPERFDQHYLGLIPLDRGRRVVITMTYDPQDQQALDQGLNFYVLDQNALNKVLFQGARPELVNIAAGNPVKAPVKTRQAELVPPLGEAYTIVVTNGSNVPAVYHLEVDNGVLVDDAGQTMESKSAQPAQAGEEAGAPAAAPAPAAVTGEQALPEVEIGKVYVVKRGDTLGTIAKAAYGDVKYYKELCAYNNIEDCNRIEVGDEVTIPTLEELTSGATAPAPTVTPTPAAEEPEPTATPTEEATPEATPTEETTPEAEATPTEEATPEAEATPTEEAMAGGATVVDVISEDGRFEILKAALQLANLTDTLQGSGPFTIFAPTDAAFALLPEETLDNLLQDPAAMAEVLKYHIIPGEVRAEDLSGTISAETLQGGMITIAVGDDGTIVVNEAKMLDSNLEASNGIVHVIDSVLIPSSEQ